MWNSLFRLFFYKCIVFAYRHEKHL